LRYRYASVFHLDERILMTPLRNEQPAVSESPRSVPKRKTFGSRFFRDSKAVSGIAVLAAGVLAAQVTGAQPARADRTVGVNDLCSAYRAGYVAKLSVDSYLPKAVCAAANEWLPGINDNLDGRLIPGTFPGLPAGSHQVNPWDPFSDWVIPGA
jgi:hypothetical protein